MKNRALSILALLLAPVAWGDLTQQLARTPAPDGNYAIVVGGFYAGQGSAKKHGQGIVLQANVTAGGQKGSLFATLSVNGTYISGQGTVLGRKFSLTGRLDAPGDAAQPRKLRSARITCMFTVEDGHRGRIAGAISLPPGQGNDPEESPRPARPH